MEIIYHPLVIKHDIPRLDKPVKERIALDIKNKIAVKPTLYGLPLRGTLHNCWKLRVGDYRVIYTLVKNKIGIVAIGPRKNVYKTILKRI